MMIVATLTIVAMGALKHKFVISVWRKLSLEPETKFETSLKSFVYYYVISQASK